MRNSWEYKELSLVTEVGAGNSAPQKKEFFINGTFPFIRTSDVGLIKKGKISNSRDKINEAASSKMKLQRKGTVLLPKSGASTFLNHRVIMTIDGYVSSHLATVKANNELLLDKFLFYFLHEIKAQELIQDHSYPSLKLSDIKSINIPIPPNEEQKEIVEILDQAFESIGKAKANIERNIENAKELFQSKLNQIFSQTGVDWTQVVIESLCNNTKNINWKENTESQFDYIDLSSVSRTSLSITETKKIDFKNAPSRAKKIVKENDIIFGTTRPTLKRATKITEKYNNQVCSTGFVVLSPKDPKDSEWIFYFLLSNKFMKRMESLQRGASYPAVSDNDVKKSILSIPSKKSIKTEMIKNLDALDNHIQSLLLSYNEELNNLEELKKSILQKAFTGELTNKNKAA